MRARLARVETGPPAPRTLEEACALLAVVWRELGVLRYPLAPLRPQCWKTRGRAALHHRPALRQERKKASVWVI
jgi:hypothetical protein